MVSSLATLLFSVKKNCSEPIKGLRAESRYFLRSTGQFPGKIIEKLKHDGVFLAAEEKFSYDSDAKADVDFHLSGGAEIVEILRGLKSHDWYEQRRAMEKTPSLNWTKVTADQSFVLGRNIYQCACGTERTAEAFLRDLRRELAKIPIERAQDVLNGLFYEVYFDSKGEYRQGNLKSDRLAELFAIQHVEKYRDCVAFIRRALAPYRNGLVVMPNTEREVLTVRLKISRKDPPIVRSVECLGQELLVDVQPESAHVPDKMWRLGLKQFGLETLKASISQSWYVPSAQLAIEVSPLVADDVRFRLPEGKTISQPIR